MNWYNDQLLAPRGVEVPVVQSRPTYINDTTNGVVIGAQASGYSFIAAGANANRVYILIQNNTTVNISLAVGNAASPTGLVIVPGGYYERQIYSFISAVYITLLAASAAGDYVTIEEGSTVTQS